MAVQVLNQSWFRNVERIDTALLTPKTESIYDLFVTTCGNTVDDCIWHSMYCFFSRVIWLQRTHPNLFQLHTKERSVFSLLTMQKKSFYCGMGNIGICYISIYDACFCIWNIGNTGVWVMPDDLRVSNLFERSMQIITLITFMYKYIILNLMHNLDTSLNSDVSTHRNRYKKC